MHPQLYSARVLQASSELAALEKLSNEVLDMILGYLAPEKADIVGLGLSSQFLWQIVLHHIHAKYLRSAGPWAGKKIAFQGSYSMDLPEPFKEGDMVESITGPDGSWFGNMCQARQFFWAHSDEDVATPYSEEAGWITAARSHIDTAEIPETCWWTIEEELGCSYLFPKKQEWLLRNLTTWETISSKVLGGSKTRKTRSGKFQSVSFDDVILMQSMYPAIKSPHRRSFHADSKTSQHVGQAFRPITTTNSMFIEGPGQATDLILSHLRRTKRKRS